MLSAVVGPAFLQVAELVRNLYCLKAAAAIWLRQQLCVSLCPYMRIISM